MQKMISILFISLLISSLSACSSTSKVAGNSSDDQRANAAKAQRELSSEVNK